MDDVRRRWSEVIREVKTVDNPLSPGSEIVRRDGTRAKLDAYSDIFWLDPGDTAIFSAP